MKHLVPTLCNVSLCTKYHFVQYTVKSSSTSSYAEKGLRILAFPCNQFGGQEPCPDEKIKQFAQARGAEYDLFSKIDVNGSGAHPLYKYMKSQCSGTLGSAIKWNFSKFLCNKSGVPVKRYGPYTDPLSCTKDIEAELAKES